jgi:hypothetical protein
MYPLLFHLDANAVNARQQDPYLNELERLSFSGIIELEYSEIAYTEAEHGNGIRKEKAEQHTWSGLSNQPDLETPWRIQIAEATFPNGIITSSQRNDVEILLTAKLAGAILVTTDGDSKSQPRGLLGGRDALQALGIRVVTPAEAVSYVYAAARDMPSLDINTA